MRILLQILIALVFCLVLFTLLEWMFPSDEHQPPSYKRKSARTADVWYWFMLPVISPPVVRIIVGTVLTLIFLAFGWERRTDFYMAGFGPIATQPKWIQIIAALLVADFAGYWIHRTFHTSRGWKFHAIHHSSKHLDWLAATRLHPINAFGNRIGQALSIVVLGFPPTVLAGWVTLLTMWDLLIHANVNWTWGPLRFFFASPVFHRWHHTLEQEAQDKNFSGMFPFWDVIFGTFYMPKGKIPLEFGVSEPVPEHFFGQIMYPFTAAANPPAAVISDAAPAQPAESATPPAAVPTATS